MSAERVAGDIPSPSPGGLLSALNEKAPGGCVGPTLLSLSVTLLDETSSLPSGRGRFTLIEWRVPHGRWG